MPSAVAVILSLLLALPWIALCLGVVLRIRFPRPLPHLRHPRGSAASPSAAPAEDADASLGGGDGAPGRAEPLPFVSVIVPARNEEDVIGACVGSLLASRYPAFEVIVVDDRSGDRTAEIARSHDAGGARRLAVADGAALPDGWLGKPWACWQGYRMARGELLLFTDADTRHGPDLLERAVRALEEDEADALSAVGRQIMERWREKLVLTQVFALIASRFRDVREPIEPGRCGAAIANGQFILVRRDAYEDVGGHETVRGEVVEDLQIARTLCRGGYRLTLREAEDELATRMYRSFSHLVEGWTKNLAVATLQTLPPGFRRWALPVGVLVGAGLWVAPPVALAAGVLGPAGPGVTIWAAAVCGVSALFWGAVSWRMGLSPLYGALYPVGSAITVAIFARSALRGGRVEWKGRTYELDEERLWSG